MTTPFPPDSTLAAYLRDSGAAKQNLSVAQQESKIRQWCDDNRFTLTLIFADIAKSGASTVGRDQLDAMLKYFESGNAKEAGVVFWDYSRWARNFDDGQFFLSSLRRIGYQAFSLEEQIPGGSTGKVIESLYLWSAEQYREQLSRNSKRGQQYLITAHRGYPGYKIPVGYQGVRIQVENRRDGSPHWITRLEPDPDKAPLVQQAFAMRAAGYATHEIHQATHLFVSAQGYNALFRNTIYQGALTWKELVSPDFCQPIIDPATWQTVQEINRSNTDRYYFYHPRRKTSDYILSGLLRCGDCGGAMTGNTMTKPQYTPRREYHYYHCRRSGSTTRMCTGLRIPKEQIEALVFQTLHEHLTNSDTLCDIYTRAQQQSGVHHAEHTVKIASAERSLAALAAQIDRTTAAIAAAGHSQALLSKLDELEQSYAVQRSDLAHLRSQAQTQTALPQLTPQEIAAVGQRLWQKLDHESDRQKQLLLRSFIHSITVSKTLDKKISGQVVLSVLPGLKEQAILPIAN